MPPALSTTAVSDSFCSQVYSEHTLVELIRDHAVDAGWNIEGLPGRKSRSGSSSVEGHRESHVLVLCNECGMMSCMQ